jgi:hypothetical protein
LAGAFLGIRYLIWEMEHRPTWSSGTARLFAAARAEGSRQPWLGLLVLGVLLVTPFAYARAGYTPQGIFLLFGVVFGVILQRSRAFCCYKTRNCFCSA